MFPNRSSCNKTIPFRCKINNVAWWIEVGAYRFWCFSEIIKATHLSVFDSNFKFIPHYIILGTEASFQHHLLSSGS